MNTGIYIYIGKNKEKLSINSILRLLCLTESLSYTILEPSINILVVLVHSKDQAPTDIYYINENKLFFYSGNYYPNDSRGCIKNTPYGTPENLYKTLNSPVSKNKKQDIHGTYGWVLLTFHENELKQISVETDKYGIHPIYYSYDPKLNELSVSNYPESLTCSMSNYELNYEVISRFFAIGLADNKSCFIQNVHRLQLGQTIRFLGDKNIFAITKADNILEIDNVEPACSIEDHFEMLYWSLREAVRRRTKNLNSLLELKLSGGLDSRFLLHCLLEDNINFRATNYWYLKKEEPDSSIPSQLSKKFNFDLSTNKSSEWNPLVNEINLIAGPGKVSDTLATSKMSGSFAAFPMKRQMHIEMDIDPFVQKNWHKLDFISSYDPIESKNNAIQRLLNFSLSSNHGGFKKAVMYQSYTAFIYDFDEPRFARPANYFRGTRHLPFCDEDLFGLSLGYSMLSFEACKEYLNLLNRRMPQMLQIPLYPSGQMNTTKKRKTREEILQQFKSRLIYFSHENQELKSIFSGVLKDKHFNSPELYIRLMLFGLWLAWIKSK